MISAKIHRLLKFGKDTTFFVVILFALFAPFFMVIRKEKMVRDYSQKKELLNAELLRLKSETVSLELSIGYLSSADRLERFALDSLGMKPADPLKVIAVQRSKDGVIITSEKSSEEFLYRLMGKQ